MQHVRFAVALAAISVSGPLTAGCFRDRGGPAAPAPAATAQSARWAAAAALAAREPLAFLPADAHLVVGVDVAQLVASDVWRQLGPRVTDQLARAFPRLSGACGAEALRSLRSFVVGIRFSRDEPEGSPTREGSPASVVTIRGLTRDHVLRCADTDWRGEVTPAPGGYLTRPAASAAEHPAVMAFIDATTLVMYQGPQATLAQLEAVLARGAPLRGSRTIGPLWRAVDMRQVGWLLAEGDAPPFAGLHSIGAIPSGISGTIGVRDEVTIQLTARFATAAAATQVADTMAPQLALLRAFAAVAEIEASGAEITARIGMTTPQLEALTSGQGGGAGPAPAQP
jgi:hypothetical protein